MSAKRNMRTGLNLVIVSIHNRPIMKTVRLHWSGLFLVGLIYLVSLLLAREQFYRSWHEFDKGLAASLTLDGRMRTFWLSEQLDPFLPEYIDNRHEIPLPNWSGASWLLLDASGEIFYGPDNFPFYAEPLDSVESTCSFLNTANIKKAQAGNEVITSLKNNKREYSKGIYLPVEVASGSISNRWILVGFVGGSFQGDTTFARLYKLNRGFWWTVLSISVASLLILLMLSRGLSRTQRLEVALQKAEESIELESLTSTLAHEIRNPLSIIRSCAEILKRDEAMSPDGQTLVNDILEEVDRSQNVLFNHLHPDIPQIEQIENFPAWLANFWEHRKPLLAMQNVTLDLSIPTGEKYSIRAVPQLLERLFENLLRNSIEALQTGGHIHCQLETVEDLVVIRFRDNGPGIARAESVYQDGFQIDAGRKGGRGIGLRLARKWVTSWGGTLSLHNIRLHWWGRTLGAEVVIRLPLVSTKIESI